MVLTLSALRVKKTSVCEGRRELRGRLFPGRNRCPPLNGPPGGHHNLATCLPSLPISGLTCALATWLSLLLLLLQLLLHPPAEHLCSPSEAPRCQQELPFEMKFSRRKATQTDRPQQQGGRRRCWQGGIMGGEKPIQRSSSKSDDM